MSYSRVEKVHRQGFLMGFLQVDFYSGFSLEVIKVKLISVSLSQQHVLPIPCLDPSIRRIQGFKDRYSRIGWVLRKWSSHYPTA